MIYKIFFIISFLSIHSVTSQPKKADEISQFAWSRELMKEDLIIPDEWKNESAVVLLDENKHFYTKTGKVLDNFFLTRKIIKLNDKAAIDKFSEFEYPSLLIDYGKEIKTWIGIKIIKPDGSIKILDIENEKIKTSTDDSIKLYGFIKVNFKSDQLYKVAVPEIEIGDIIDYYIYTYEEYNSYGFDAMTPVETTLKGSYPIVDFSLELTVENDFFINFNSYNGAPDLQDITEDKQRDKKYLLSAKKIEKADPIQWIYPLNEYPSYKYRVTFVQKGKYEKYAHSMISDDEDIVKRYITSDNIFDAHNDRYPFDLISKDLKKRLKENENMGKKELLEDIYFYMRHMLLGYEREKYIAYKEKLSLVSTSVNLNDDATKIWSYHFIIYYGSFLKEIGVPFEILISQNRYDGKIEDAVVPHNFNYLIRANVDGENIYLPNFKTHIFPNSIPALMEEAQAYAISYNKKGKGEKIELITLPTSSHQNNNSTVITDVNFSDDYSNTHIENKTSLKGQNKIHKLNDIVNYFEYLPEDHIKYNSIPYADRLKKKEKEKYIEKFNTYKEKILKEKEESLKENIEETHEVKINDYKFSYENFGRYSFDELFTYSEKFTVTENLMKKIGSNYLFNVGKLIGRQVAIETKDKTRSEDIYMPYARSFNNVINVEIPEGYTVKGIEKLNSKTENQTGGFVSEVNLKGNKLEIKTYKYYKNNYEPNSNWKDMVAFLEAAYQFSQEKILFEKI